jgi:hypothetical protein
VVTTSHLTTHVNMLKGITYLIASCGIIAFLLHHYLVDGVFKDEGYYHSKDDEIHERCLVFYVAKELRRFWIPIA